MNVIVCLKQVPGTTDVKVNPQTNTLIRQGVENVINPFDTYALEEGVRTKERYGEGKVTAMSMGPPQAEAVMREAISLGADEAVLLSDKAFAGADTWATAYTLAQAINKIGQHDIIICGRQTIDGDTGQVGPELADGRIRVQRMVEEGHEVIESSLPAVITVVKEINVPRLPSLRGITRSKSALVAIWSAREIGVDESRVGLAGSFTKVIKVFFPQRVSQSEVFQGEMESQVDCLIDRLKDTGLT